MDIESEGACAVPVDRQGFGQAGAVGLAQEQLVGAGTGFMRKLESRLEHVRLAQDQRRIGLHRGVAIPHAGG